MAEQVGASGCCQVGRLRKGEIIEVNIVKVDTVEMDINTSILASLQLQYPLVRSINSNLSLKMIGLSSLYGLSEFTGVRCLDASNNNLDHVDSAHLSFMTDLRILKLQHNKISQVPSLAANPLLHTLDLSSNAISHVSGLSHLPSLHSLQLSSNRLTSAESVNDLTNCPLLENLELNGNQIRDRDVLVLLSTLPALKWLQMRGNPIASTLIPYRKNIVGTITRLVALDGEAVEERERFFAAAFVSGGTEAEKTARDAFNEAVTVYNVKVTSFPNNILAGMFGFKEKTMFQAEAGSEKAPKVKF